MDFDCYTLVKLIQIVLSLIYNTIMFGFIQKVALDVTLDVTLSVAWWLTKQVTYGTINTFRYMVTYGK